MYRVIQISVLIVACTVPAIAAEPRDLHETFHAAVHSWIAGDEDRALSLIDRGAGSNDGDLDDRALLADLGARILSQKALPLFGEQRHTVLERAEYRAAQAVAARPMNLDFWRDYMSIAENELGEEKLLGRLDGGLPWDYENFDLHVVTLFSNEQRTIARAVVEMGHGRGSDAVDRLKRYVAGVAGAESESCAARILLAELEFHLDRTAAARTALEESSEACRGLPIAAALASRLTEVEAAFPYIAARTSDSSSTDNTFSETIVVRPGRAEPVDRHRADLESSVLRDPQQIQLWHDLWRMLMLFDDGRAGEWDQVVALADRISPSSEGRVASVYASLGRGKFQNALTQSSKLLKKRPEDPEIHSARLLAGSVVGEENHEYQDSLDIVWSSSPGLAQCLARDEIELCLARHPHCTLGAILCRDPNEFVLEAFDHGWATLPRQVRRASERGLRAETLARLDADRVLRIEVAANSRAQEERLDAMRVRIELAIMPRIAEIETNLRGVIDRQAKLDRALEQERRETRKRIELLARQTAEQIGQLGSRLALTQQEVQHLLMRLAANHVAIDGMNIDSLAPQLGSYAEQHPREVASFNKSLIDRMVALEARVRAEGNVGTILNDIGDECIQPRLPSAPCLRSVLKLAKKYVSVQWVPGAPVPVISIDLMAIGDTVLEVIDRSLRATSKMSAPKGD